MSFEKIFTPMKIGTMTVKNRLIVPAMGSETAAPDGTVTDFVEHYYAARARGGFGMVIVEFSPVANSGRVFSNQLMISEDRHIPGLTRLASAIKQNDCRAVIQIHHAGRQTVKEMAGVTPLGVSGVRCPAVNSEVREMTTKEVYAMVEDFIRGAERAKMAGFDAVELHCGHGYMLQQFLSPRSNKRIDEFGGRLEGRTLIHKLIVRGIKDRLGETFPVMIRLSSEDGRIGGYGVREAVLAARLFESYGFDALHVTAGTYARTEIILPPSDLAPGWNLEATRQIKEALSIPVIAVGRYSDPQTVEYVIDKGFADFVAIGRQSICDPDYANKLRGGDLADIIPCLSCNHRCTVYHVPKYEEIGDHGISCVINPLSADRPELRLTPVKKVKKVMVVGAGPAGLEAAWIAAARGHKVSLYEKNPRTKAGGQFLVAAYPPFKQGIAAAIRYYLEKCEKTGVNMVFEKEVDNAFVKAQKPDVLIIATGALPVAPKIKGMDLIPVAQAGDVLTGAAQVSGKVLVVGGGQVGVETADFCTDYCDKVTVLEMMPDFAMDMEMNTRIRLFERLKAGGKVELKPNIKVMEFSKGCATCELDGESVVLDGYDSVILAIGSRANNPFIEHENLAGEVYVVGDAVRARSAVQAFFEAAKVAVSI
ncbi:NAD(P)/FAD-dependent oxidoreductase [Desulfovibrio sp. OttesenSCG-928-C14]|nr:NAD(P)/FAD-dependent oxidoreductase [Desulfovibrio sp. OttesenSCG-928-C14]